jgi:hypothetical protein
MQMPPKTRVGLADPPNNAPTTDTISEADDAPFAKTMPEKYRRLYRQIDIGY